MKKGDLVIAKDYWYTNKKPCLGVILAKRTYKEVTSETSTAKEYYDVLLENGKVEKRMQFEVKAVG